jgi:tetratricopeptide (TPR) repeat protein
MPVAVILVVNAEEAEERKDFTSLVMWILRHLKALCQRISLQPLAGSEFCEFVGRLAPLDDPSRDAVFRLSQGNPFFTQEVLQFLYDEGVLVQDGSRYVITRDVSQLPDVPLSLREMVTRKLERLKEKSPLARDCRAVLEHLALFGERMPLRLLQDALERQGRDELKARLDEIVEELCEHRLTRVESRRNQDFLEPYHAIISYALSVEMGHGLRGRRIHGIFADLLEAGEARKEPLVLERIAHHCRLAGDRGRGMRFYYEAGLEWERRFDLLRARTCFEEWLALDAVEPGEVEAALDARYHLAQVVLLDGQVDLAEQHFRHILESADPATGTVFFGRALVGLGDILPEDSDLREALQQLRQAAAYFRRHGQRVDLARAVERQGGLAAQGGRLAVADLLYGAAERMYSEAQARAELASLYNRRGLLAIQRAGVKEATELFERGLAIQDELNNPVECARAYNNIAMALMQQGAAGEAEKVLRKALQRLEALRHPWGLATVRLNLAIALVMQRDFYSGRDVLEQALQTARSVFSRRIIARILANQATVEAELGNPRRAVRLAHESLEIREELKVPLEVASALAIVGDVHGRAGEPDLARDYLRQAVVVFERAGLQNSLVAETYQRLAELEHHSGDRKAARTWHDKARRISEVLGRAPGSLPSDPELDPPPPRDPEPPKDAPPRLKSGRPSSALVFAPAAASGISL